MGGMPLLVYYVDTACYACVRWSVCGLIAVSRRTSRDSNATCTTSFFSHKKLLSIARVITVRSLRHESGSTLLRKAGVRDSETQTRVEEHEGGQTDVQDYRHY